MFTFILCRTGVSSQVGEDKRNTKDGFFQWINHEDSHGISRLFAHCKDILLAFISGFCHQADVPFDFTDGLRAT